LPLGTGIGSSKGVFHPRLATGASRCRFPVVRHSLASIETAVLFGVPIAGLARCLKIAFGPFRQEHRPSCLEAGAGLVESRRGAVSAFPGVTTGIEAAGQSHWSWSCGMPLRMAIVLTCTSP
jgi:hypothetical protein